MSLRLTQCTATVPALVLLLVATSVQDCDAHVLNETDATPAADVVWTFVTRAVESAVSSHFSQVDSQLRGVAADLAAGGARDQQSAAELSHLQSQLTELFSLHESSEEQLRSLRTELELVGADVAASLRELRSQQATDNWRDCSDLPAGSPSGVYTLRASSGRLTPAYCDQETAGGGWTVFQRRADIQPRQDFYRGWQDYKWGFGRLNAEFWWGLENIWLMTTPLDRQYELRVDMKDFDGATRHALYQDFHITSEADGFRLKITNYTGDSGDSLLGSANAKFTSKDRDQDVWPKNCAVSFKGAWWYTKCHGSNLNGQYLAGNHTSYADGVNWSAFRGYHHSLKNTEMKIRPALKL